MKILITGTHFTPAQAVMEELKNHPGVEISYIGRKYTKEGDQTPSVESQILPKMGVKFIPLTSGRLQRSFTFYTIPSLLKIPWGFLSALYLVAKEKPDVTLSFGGYVGLPVVFASWLLSVPIIIHEQTLIPGLANQLSSLFADKKAVSFPRENSEINVILTGNPIRKEIFSASPKAGFATGRAVHLHLRSRLPLIFVTGGNQGSHLINQTVSDILEELTEFACVIEQTGDSKYLDFEQALKKKQSLAHPDRFLAKKWLDAEEMAKILKTSDLVISRAGINTMLELAYLGVPALVIPIPYLTHDEQNTNAQYFAKLGLAKILPQEKLTPENLLENIKEMLKDLPNLKENAQKAKNAVIPDAAKRLSLETLLLGKKKS